MSNQLYTGINIQWPISQDIASGQKVVETRTYPIPEIYLNKEMLLVETPGPKGKFKARIIAIIKFTECHEYKNKKEFYNDSKKHLVTKDSPWAWKDKKKFGWKVEFIKEISPPQEVTQRGIVYRTKMKLKS